MPWGEGIKREIPAVQKYLELVNGVLYRNVVLDGQKIKQLILPAASRNLSMKGIYDDAGYQGKEKTLWLAKQHFYWPGLEQDINKKVEHCGRCIRRKTPVRPVSPY